MSLVLCWALDGKLTNKIDRPESNKKYREPTTVTMSTLTTPMIKPKGNNAFRASSLPEADGGVRVRKGFNK